MTLDPSKDPNTFFRAKLGGGQAALRILLAQKPVAAVNAGNQASSGQSDNQSRARSYRRREDELIPKKKKGLLNFWDLGQIKDIESGLWLNNTFIHDPEPVVWLNPDPVHASDEIRFNADIVLTNVRAYETDYLDGGLDPSTIETKYRQVPKIAAGAFYITATVDGVDYNFDSPEWTDSGLKVTSISSLVIKAWKQQAIGGDVAEMSVQLDIDPSITKCTTGDTFASPVIAFSPKAGDKWFLSPMLRFSRGTSIVTASSVATFTVQNLFYVTVPRDFDHPDALVQFNPGTQPGSDFNLVYPVHQAVSGARTLTVVEDQSAHPGVSRVSLSVGGTFPQTDPLTSNDFIGFAPGNGSELPGGNATSEAQFVGQLAGICKQGTILYYFWRKTT